MQTGRQRYGPLRLLIGAAGVLLFCSASGCGWLRVIYAPEMGSRNRYIQTVHADSTTRSAEPETSYVELPPAIPVPRRTQRVVPNPAASRAEDAGKPQEDRQGTGGTDSLALSSPNHPATAEPTSGGPPHVSVALPEAERLKLIRSARKEIAAADSIAAAVAPRLYRDRDRDALDTIRGLTEQAKAALDREDVRAASNLAHKARLLASELATK